MTIRHIHRPLLLPMAIAVLAASLPPRPAAADQGRYEAMAENPMVRDDLDIAAFPGLLTTYGNQVFLSVRDNATTGDVGAIIGRDIAFGLWIHRTPRWRDLQDTDELFDSFVLPETYHLADLLFGMSNGFGLRLSFSGGLAADDGEDSEGEELLSTGGSTFALDLQLGYSMDTHSYHGDFAAGLSFTYFEVLLEGQQTHVAQGVPSFVLRHRSIFGPRRPLTWVLDLLLTRRAYTAKATGDPETLGGFDRWIGTMVTGPQLMLPGNLTLWVGLQLEVERLGGEVGGDRQPSLLALGPGAVASAELLLWGLLAIRAGVAYDFFWASTEIPSVGGSEAGAHQELGQRFRWSTGLGVIVEGFRLDATLSHQLYFGGPQAIGGGTPGLMGTVSAAYAW